MNDTLLQFLLIIVFLFIGITRAYKKENRKQTDSPDQKPADEGDYDNYGDKEVYSEKGSEEQTTSPRKQSLYETFPAKPKQVRHSYSPLIFTDSEEASVSSECEQDYDIHSVEEIRRAIIWSEILHRKY
jgi:hypothetical protein